MQSYALLVGISQRVSLDAAITGHNIRSILTAPENCSKIQQGCLGVLLLEGWSCRTVSSAPFPVSLWTAGHAPDINDVMALLLTC